MSSQLSKVKRLDIFGSKIGFNIDGSETHQTYMGALFTLVTVILSVIYGSIRFKTMIDKDDTQYQETVETNFLDPK